MAGFKQRVLRENGFTGRNPSCLEAEVCPGPALSDFLIRGEGKVHRSGHRGDAAATARLRPAPGRAARPEDRRLPGHIALLSFGIRAQSLDDQQALIDRVRAEIGEPGAPGGPPAGVEVQLAGLPVIAAAAGVRSLRQPLLADARRARSPSPWSCSLVYRSLAPRAGAAGADRARHRLGLAGALAHRDPAQPDVGGAGGADDRDRHRVQRDPLRPASTRSAAAGVGVAEALRRAYARTGAAVLASGVTAIAGFAVLIASDIQMLRDFGFVTVIDLAVALLGVMVALPAALVLELEER